MQLKYMEKCMYIVH
uniref:Uncharacterized protein n=1 Tax=Anguilla anguilla TaxID=7936 RepID=A0A0E9QAP6_ANGAN